MATSNTGGPRKQRSTSTNRFNADHCGTGFRIIQQIGDITASVGTEAADVIIVTFQLKDMKGRNPSGRHIVYMAVHDAVFGTLATDSTFIGTPVATGTLIEEITTDKSCRAWTDADGTVSLSITDPGVDTFYVSCTVGDVTIVSGACTFA